MMTRLPDVDDGDVADGVQPLDHERLVDSTTKQAIFQVAPDGTIESWPPAARTIYEYERDAIVDRPLAVLLADEAAASDELDRLLVGARDEAVDSEHWHERQDGTVFWASLSLSPIHEEPAGDGETVTGFAAVSRDVTAAKQYERMLERQNDRLKEFTDILSHDLQSPLAVLRGRLDRYEMTGDPDEIEAMHETVDRVERLVEDLLSVARQGDVVTNPSTTDLESVVDTAWEGATGPHATLEYEPVPAVSADSDRLVEVFENLFRNAVEHGSTSPHSQAHEDAVEHGSTNPPSQAREEAVEDESTSPSSQARGAAVDQKGSAVTVRVGPMPNGVYVADDGPGISTEARSDVFDHGFTTAGDGTGYGLSIVRTIVGAHGWDVAVTESDSGGARFEITGIEFLE